MPPALPSQEFLKQPNIISSQGQKFTSVLRTTRAKPCLHILIHLTICQKLFEVNHVNLTAGLFFQSVSSSYKPSVDVFQRHTVQMFAVWYYLRQILKLNRFLFALVHYWRRSIRLEIFEWKMFSFQKTSSNWRFLLLLMFTSFYKFCVCNVLPLNLTWQFRFRQLYWSSTCSQFMCGLPSLYTSLQNSQAR